LDSSGLWRVLTVGCGGFVGAAARYAIGGAVHRLVPTPFPLGTFLVNATGCFAIGLLATILEERAAIAPGLRLFWLIGVLGGYTTFSTFGFETIALLREGSLPAAALNVLGQVAVGLVAVWIGMALGRALS
jgi:CrcB protein